MDDDWMDEVGHHQRNPKKKERQIQKTKRISPRPVRSDIIPKQSESEFVAESESESKPKKKRKGGRKKKNTKESHKLFGCFVLFSLDLMFGWLLLVSQQQWYPKKTTMNLGWIRTRRQTYSIDRWHFLGLTFLLNTAIPVVSPIKEKIFTNFLGLTLGFYS